MSDFSRFTELLERSARIVVLTGAGVSTLSGIPDFRSSDGLYSKEYGRMRVEDILDISFFLAHPDVFYSWAEPYWYHMDEYEPDIIHRTLQKMEAKGKLSEGIFTQNIDMLHQKAGSKKVYELHGSLARGFCRGCGKMFTYKEMEESVRKGEVPRCPLCSSLIKPDIVFYGEGLDSTTLMRAENAFSNADLAIVLGSSLAVNPAASLPYISVQRGRNLVIVNKSRTYIDEYAAMRFTDLGSFFTLLDEYLSG